MLEEHAALATFADLLCLTDTKVVYRRYASLFFVMGIGQSDNELVALEIIHRYVELLDKYFGNVGPCFLNLEVAIDADTRATGVRTGSVRQARGPSLQMSRS